jgi:hypothetical protein
MLKRGASSGVDLLMPPLPLCPERRGHDGVGGKKGKEFFRIRGKTPQVRKGAFW